MQYSKHVLSSQSAQASGHNREPLPSKTAATHLSVVLVDAVRLIQDTVDFHIVGVEGLLVLGEHDTDSTGKAGVFFLIVHTEVEIWGSQRKVAC